MDLHYFQPNRSRAEPVYMQLYQRFREAIAAGMLQPAERVPSVRSLASALNLARGTVEQAYQMLVSEGYFITRGAAGTQVSPHLPGQIGGAAAQPAGLPAGPTALLQGAAHAPLPFQLGLPALDAFPVRSWARLAGRRLRQLDATALAYPDPAGDPALRRAIASYLGVARGIACAPEQVLLTTGYGGALELICRTLLQRGDSGWHEDPGYILGRQLLEHLGMQLQPVPVDGAGLNVAEGRRRSAHARFALVTPTHQSPTGVALSLPRRLALLDWARAQEAWVIEDDYDSEFRYQGRPLPALKCLDNQGRVLYVGTFSKVLFPGLRLAYLVVPLAQAARFRAAAEVLAGPGSVLAQAVVADFMEQGHFVRHLRRMRMLYGQRRALLQQALGRLTGDWLHLQPQAGGIQLLAHLADGLEDRPLAARARQAGLAVQALGDWRMQAATPAGLIMGFANFADAAQAESAVARLRAVLQGA